VVNGEKKKKKKKKEVKRKKKRKQFTILVSNKAICVSLFSLCLRVNFNPLFFTP